MQVTASIFTARIRCCSTFSLQHFFSRTAASFTLKYSLRCCCALKAAKRDTEASCCCRNRQHASHVVTQSCTTTAAACCAFSLGGPGNPRAPSVAVSPRATGVFCGKAALSSGTQGTCSALRSSSKSATYTALANRGFRLTSPCCVFPDSAAPTNARSTEGDPQKMGASPTHHGWWTLLPMPPSRAGVLKLFSSKDPFYDRK